MARGNNNSGMRQNGPNMGNLLNLERVPNLAPKFANKLGKTAAGYAVFYEAGATRVAVKAMIGPNGRPLTPPANGEYPLIDLVEFERRVAIANAPSNDERIFALRRKYELRLERAFPENGPASGSEADIQAWMSTLSLEERIALLKSQKDWEKSKSVPAARQ
jgi:hypothetical protein